MLRRRGLACSERHVLDLEQIVILAWPVRPTVVHVGIGELDKPQECQGRRDVALELQLQGD